MQKSRFYHMLMMTMAVMTGCHLTEMPECLVGEQKCVDEGVTSTVLSCNSSNHWDRMYCESGCTADGETCRSSVSKCTTEGEVKCLDTDNGVSVELTCRKGNWVPSVCASGTQCADNHCAEIDLQCSSGARKCVDNIEGHSLVIGCNSEKFWVSRYCTTTICDAEQNDCAAVSDDACQGKNEGDSCDKGPNNVAVCRMKQCTVIGCADGYHTSESGCAMDSETACGNTRQNCLSFANVVKAQCENGSCVVSACNEGYNIVNKSACVSQDAFSCGPNKVDCSRIKDVADVTCESDQCKVLSCVPGFHPDSDKTECLPDSTDVCGSALTNCRQIPDVKSVNCVNGLCVVSECINGKRVSDDKTGCTEDSETSCGFEKTNCTLIEDAVNVACDNGVCRVDKCKDGNHIDSKRMACEKDSPEHCGNSNTNCRGISGVKDVDCLNGVCQVKSCVSGHHVVGTGVGAHCESDNVSNCNGVNCKTENVESATCERGHCAILKCKDGYHISGNECVSDAEGCLSSLNINTADGKYTNSNVKCIDGTITMAENTTEVSLPNLETVKGVICNGSFCELARIKSIIWARDLTKLSMPKLKSSGGITLFYSKLTEFSYPLLDSLDQLNLKDNKEINDVELPALKKVDNNVSIYGGGNLQSINLPALQSTGKQLAIGSHEGLNSIDLSALESVGEHLVLEEIDGLQKIEIPKLSMVGAYLNISSTSLHEINFSRLVSIDGWVLISNNANLTCVEICEFKNVSIVGSLSVSGNKSSFCTYDSKNSDSTFKDLCSSLGY